MIKKSGSRKIKSNIYKYIKENFNKGHKINSIKKWLIAYGYDESFVFESIKRFQTRQFIKKASLPAFIVAVTLLFVSLPLLDNNITGAFVGIGKVGCCIDNSGFCYESYSEMHCNSKDFMYIRHDCFDLPYCKNNTS